VSTLAIAILSGIIGALVGVILGRTLDPMHQQHQQQSTTLQKNRQELDELRSQVKDHFTHSANALQQLSDNTLALQNQLAAEALKISGLDLTPKGNQHSEGFRLAQLISNDGIEPPRDYAPKEKNSRSTLSEEYGLRDDEYETQKVQG